jgi:hypothetical protein
MSLENKIELLTASIDALRATIKAQSKEVAAPVSFVEPVTDPVADVEPVVVDFELLNAEPEQSQLKHKDVQDFLLSFVRKDQKLKSKIKTILSEFSASKVSDIDVARLSEFKAKVEML